MTNQNKLFRRLSSLKDLPTLPHILLKLIEACNRNNPDLNEIGNMVSSDPALSAKILKLVNSAFFGLPHKIDLIHHAVAFVGTSGIKSLAICACVYEVFPKPSGKSTFNLKQFWWHSLRCAFLAKLMATEQDVCQPDEAFLAGLLHDIGKLVLWVNFKTAYETMVERCSRNTDLLLAGEANMGATHAEVGAWLMERWNLDPSITDCVRYHHEQTERITHAFAMVQIIHIANLLCQNDLDKINVGLTSAKQLLNLDTSKCQALIDNADEQAREVASSLDINIETVSIETSTPDANDKAAKERLACEFQDFSLAMGALEGFLTAKSHPEILKCMADGLNLIFNARRCIFFLIDEKRKALASYITDQNGIYVKQPRLAVSMDMHGSLLVNTISQNRAMDSFAAESMAPLAIIDEQIIRLLCAEGMFCLPLVIHDDPVGVLAMGIKSEDLPNLLEKTRLLKIIMQKGAAALRVETIRRRELQVIHEERIAAASDLARRVVHEANNPLSVIKNYTKVIGMRMTSAGLAHDELRIIGDEVSRVSRLLQKLTAFSKNETSSDARSDVNALLSDVITLIGGGAADTANIDFKTELGDNIPIAGIHPDGLKQVFINLIKNAVEAMSPKGGCLSVRTRFIPAPLGAKPADSGGRTNGSVEIVIADNGPGIEPEIRETLFDPYVSTKKGEHSGLGLSIAHNIIRSSSGTIVCNSVPGQGTTFTIELPV